MAHTSAIAASHSARKVAIVALFLAGPADVAGNVRTRPNVTIFAFIPKRPFRILTGQPGRESLIADAFVYKGVRRRGQLCTLTAAGVAGATARTAALERASETAVTRGPMATGAGFGSEPGALRGRALAFRRLTGRRLIGLRGLRRV